MECLPVVEAGVRWERKVGGDLFDPSRMGLERKGKLKQVIYYRAGRETGDWIWRRRGEDLHQPTFFSDRR